MAIGVKMVLKNALIPNGQKAQVTNHLTSLMETVVKKVLKNAHIQNVQKTPAISHLPVNLMLNPEKGVMIILNDLIQNEVQIREVISPSKENHTVQPLKLPIETILKNDLIQNVPREALIANQSLNGMEVSAILKSAEKPATLVNRIKAELLAIHQNPIQNEKRDLQRSLLQRLKIQKKTTILIISG